MAEENEDGPKLSDIFSDLWKTYEFLEETEEPSNSPKIQEKIKKAVEVAEKAITMVNMLSLFSTNEDFEEVVTSEIRYMLLPALLGYFCTKEMGKDRLEVLKKSRTCYMDYLKLVKYYGVSDFKLPKIDDEEEEEDKQKPKPIAPSKPDIKALEAARQLKIDRFRKQKETKERLKELRSHVESGKADDETERDYYKTLLGQWIYTSLEEVESIQNELPILKHMAKLKDNAAKGVPLPDAKEEKPKGAFRPFIITKNQLQAQVIGEGYPSLPTYTVDDFYEWRYKEELEKMKGQKNATPASLFGMPEGDPRDEEEREAIEKEEKEDSDDPVEIARRRAFDDWKDMHRKGWGNRHNRH